MLGVYVGTLPPEADIHTIVAEMTGIPIETIRQRLGKKMGRARLTYDGQSNMATERKLTAHVKAAG